MQYDDNIYCLDIPKARSSLIEKIEYDDNDKVLVVKLRYDKNPKYYKSVEYSFFEDMCQAESIGKYYLRYIKPNFQTFKNYQMADEKKKLPTKNEASTKYRFIDMSINVREILKQWIHSGEKGDYLNMVLHMRPDGEVDAYGNLGMITQKVPKSVYDAAEKENKGSGKDIKGPILGNAAEIDWDKLKGGGGGFTPGSDYGTLGTSEEDKLPF